MRHLCLVPLLGGLLLASPSWASEPSAPTSPKPAASTAVSEPLRWQIQILSNKGRIVSTTAFDLSEGHGKIEVVTADTSRVSPAPDHAKTGLSVNRFDGHVIIQVVSDDGEEWKISGDHIVVTVVTPEKISK